MSQRTDRVDELLRQEIGRILAKDLQDPRIGFATVTEVETSPDLGHARVRVSVIGTPQERDEALAALQRAMGYVRHELGTRLSLRRIPALHVSLDDSAERGTRVLQILEELEQGRDAEGEALADAPIVESLPTPVPRTRREGDAEPAEPAEPPEPLAPPGGGEAAAGARGRSSSRRPRTPGSRPGPSRPSRPRTGGKKRPKDARRKDER